MRNAQLNLFADGGYSDSMLATPGKYVDHSKAKIDLCALRSIVETALGIVGYFKISSNKFRGTPFEQVMCIIICYELTQWKMMKSLLRAEYFPIHLQRAVYDLADKILEVTPEEVEQIWLAAWEKDKSCIEELDSPICDPAPRRLLLSALPSAEN